MYLLVFSLGILSSFNQNVIAQKSSSTKTEYYITLDGDTILCNILRFKPRTKKLYYYLKGRGYWVFVDSIQGFSEKRSGYLEITPEFIMSLEFNYWRKDTASDILTSSRFGLGVGLQINLLNTKFERYENYGRARYYPYFSNVICSNKTCTSRELENVGDSYKNAYGFVRREMPYLELVFRDSKLLRFAVDIGFLKSHRSGEYFPLIAGDDIYLKDRHFIMSFDRPISRMWVRTRGKSSGIRYPFFGFDISLNSKSLEYRYDKFDDTDGSNTILLYNEHSFLLLIQTKLGVHKEIGSIYYTYGITFNLYGFASGSYNYSLDHVLSNVPASSYSFIEQDRYTNNNFLQKYGLHNMFFVAGYRF